MRWSTRWPPRAQSDDEAYGASDIKSAHRFQVCLPLGERVVEVYLLAGRTYTGLQDEIR
jgi:hypothetical protein